MKKLRRMLWAALSLVVLSSCWAGGGQERTIEMVRQSYDECGGFSALLSLSDNSGAYRIGLEYQKEGPISLALDSGQITVTEKDGEITVSHGDIKSKIQKSALKGAALWGISTPHSLFAALAGEGEVNRDDARFKAAIDVEGEEATLLLLCDAGDKKPRTLTIEMGGDKTQIEFLSFEFNKKEITQ